MLFSWFAVLRHFKCFCVLLHCFSQVYKEQVLEPMLNGTEKTPALISDYKEYHTDTTVKFVVKMTEEKLAQAEAAGLHKVFKLQTSLTCNSMVTFSCLAIRIPIVACCKLNWFCSILRFLVLNSALCI